jgi:hypothetical protein
LSFKSNTKIPLRTKSRLKQESEYSGIISKMNEQKNIFCFFCGKRMNKPEDHHHLLGREGELLTYKKYIVHAHRTCHKDYHDTSALNITWFNDYLNRLSDIDEQLAYRESLKLKK